jgi:agmatine deiminase
VSELAGPPPAGSRPPAETAPHERTLLAWPTRTRRRSLWRARLDEARDAHATVARSVAHREPVTVVADPSDADDARRRCGEAVTLLEAPIDDSWVRDSGPVVVRGPDGVRRAVHFGFNAWGEKFTPYAHDAAIGGVLAEHLGLPCHRAPFVLEGGAVAHDGDGTVVTTERCLLNPNRNPGLVRADLEGLLGEWLGAERVVWLADAIAEDAGTDGHVDNVVAFLAPGRALLQGCDDDTNANHAIARDNRERLAAAGIDVVEVPVLPYAEVDGTRVPVPYVNLYPCNGAVVVPTCGHPADADVLDLVGACYPGREVVDAPGAVLAYGGGGVHCITQQVPA